MSAALRRAAIDDLERILALERATFPDDAWSEATLRHELSSDHGWYLVAEDPDHPEQVAGYGGLGIAGRPGEEQTADIQTLAVAPWARRHGLGRAILQALLTEGEVRGLREVLLEVRADNAAARALYESERFAEIARRPRYYPGGVAAVVMRRPL